MITLFLFGKAGFLFKALIVLGLVGLYLYAKVAPHKDRLDPKYKGWFDNGDKVFGGLSRMFNMKPKQIGDNLFLDMGQFVLFCILAGLALAMMMGL